MITPAAREPRGASGAALIAGVATLLVALAVGVLIGRSGQRPVASSPNYRVVTVPAAGAVAAAATVTPSAVATTTAAKTQKKGKTAAKKQATPEPQKAPTPPPTVKVGQKGHGRGYKNGKFTGDFFGP